MRIVYPTCIDHGEVISICNQYDHLHHAAKEAELCDSALISVGPEVMSAQTFLETARRLQRQEQANQN